jgi:hypothetical protein
MSIPKEKTILLKIKEIMDNYKPLTAYAVLREIKDLTDSYEDRGYIGGPIVGEAEGGSYKIEPGHSIRCASYTSPALESRGHIPGKCDCKVLGEEETEEV